MVSYPFMLVHEVLFHLVLALVNTILQHIDFAPNSGFAKMKNDFSRTYNLPDEPLIPIGIHGDGVELRKRMSMEAISWNVCSWDGSKRHIFTCVEKQDVCDCGCGGRCTLDAILEVFVWSMTVLLIGVWPSNRHNQEPWLPRDKSRANKTGELHVRACLLQCRGDWPLFKWLF